MDTNCPICKSANDWSGINTDPVVCALCEQTFWPGNTEDMTTAPQGARRMTQSGTPLPPGESSDDSSAKGWSPVAPSAKKNLPAPQPDPEVESEGSQQTAEAAEPDATPEPETPAGLVEEPETLTTQDIEAIEPEPAEPAAVEQAAPALDEAPPAPQQAPPPLDEATPVDEIEPPLRTEPQQEIEPKLGFKDKAVSALMKAGSIVGIVPKHLVSSAHEGHELRDYYRIPSMVPVYYQVHSVSAGPIDQEVRTGLTRNMSQTGVCLQLRSPSPSVISRLNDPSTLSDLRLQMDIGLPNRVLRVHGEVAWVEQDSTNAFLLGVKFEGVDPTLGTQIAGFAKRSGRKPILIRGGIAVLALLVVTMAIVHSVSVSSHEDELESIGTELEDAMTRYEKVTTDLQRQTHELDNLARKTRALLAASQPEGDEQTLEDLQDTVAADTLGTDIGALGNNISNLQKTITTLKEKLERVGATTKKRANRKGKKRRRKRRKR